MTYNKEGEQMTSEEALKLAIRSSLFAKDNDELREIYEAREKLEKDLEILEILKSHMNIETDYYDDNSYEQYEYIAYNNLELDIDNKEEYKKIKEWLEE